VQEGVQKDLLRSVITGEVPFRFLNNKFLKWAFAVGVHIKFVVCFTLFCFRMLCTRAHTHAHAHAPTHMHMLFSDAVELDMDTML